MRGGRAKLAALLRLEPREPTMLEALALNSSRCLRHKAVPRRLTGGASLMVIGRAPYGLNSGICPITVSRRIHDTLYLWQKAPLLDELIYSPAYQSI